MRTLFRMIVEAIPTCTLWRYDPLRRVYRFRPLPWLYITELDVWLVSRGLL